VNLRSLKHFCAVPPVYGLNIAAENYTSSGVRLLRTTDVGVDGRLRSETSGVFVDPAQVPPEYLLREGDLLLSRSGTLGRSLLFGEPSGPTTHAGYLVRFRPAGGIVPSYLGYCAQSLLMQDAVAADAVESTIGNFNAEKYANVRLPWWPTTTQSVIADYLDRETARIDAMIAAKRRIVDLLVERVRLLARDLTTRHPTMVPLRRVVRAVRTGTTPPSNLLPHLTEGPVPWFSPGDIHGWLELGSSPRTLKSESVSNGWVPSFPGGSTLLVGIGATAGKVAYLADGPASGNQQMTCLVPNDVVYPRFLTWQLFARRNEILATAPFTTLPIINNDFIKDLRVHLPSVQDQKKIVAHLDQEAKNAGGLTSRVGKQNLLLLERRQAIITAAVTGQLDLPEPA